MKSKALQLGNLEEFIIIALYTIASLFMFDFGFYRMGYLVIKIYFYADKYT